MLLEYNIKKNTAPEKNMGKYLTMSYIFVFIREILIFVK